MGNLKGEFNISLVRTDYFYQRIRECWYSKNKTIKEEYIAFVFREFLKATKQTNIHKHVLKIYVSRHFMGHYFIFAENSQWDYPSVIIQFRLKRTEFD